MIVPEMIERRIHPPIADLARIDFLHSDLKDQLSYWRDSFAWQTNMMIRMAQKIMELEKELNQLKSETGWSKEDRVV